jgi:hypothetical protein
VNTALPMWRDTLTGVALKAVFNENARRYYSIDARV